MQKGAKVATKNAPEVVSLAQKSVKQPEFLVNTEYYIALSRFKKRLNCTHLRQCGKLLKGRFVLDGGSLYLPILSKSAEGHSPPPNGELLTALSGKKKGDRWYNHLVPMLNLLLNLFRLWQDLDS